MKVQKHRYSRKIKRILSRWADSPARAELQLLKLIHRQFCKATCFTLKNKRTGQTVRYKKPVYDSDSEKWNVARTALHEARELWWAKYADRPLSGMSAYLRDVMIRRTLRRLKTKGYRLSVGDERTHRECRHFNGSFKRRRGRKHRLATRRTPSWVEWVDTWDELRACCADETDRRIISLKAMELPTPEVARQLGINERTVRRRLNAIEAEYDRRRDERRDIRRDTGPVGSADRLRILAI